MSEVKIINPEYFITPHCADRVRLRVLEGSDRSAEDPKRVALSMLKNATLETRKPSGLFGDGTADLWAICDDHVFSLRRDRGKLVAITVLNRAVVHS